MSEENLLALPFEEYINVRTRYAVQVAQRTNLIDMDYAALALLQSMWAREYWMNKNVGGV